MSIIQPAGIIGADVPRIDGVVKGVGELGVVGVNAAIANAIFHATGVRLRELPIRIEKLLGSELMRVSDQ